MRTKTYYQDCGLWWAVAITGEARQDIVEQSYSYWNHHAWDGELTWWCDTFAVFACKPEKLRQAVYDGAHSRPERTDKERERLFEERWAAIKPMRFLGLASDSPVYCTGQISAENKSPLPRENATSSDPAQNANRVLR
jgi:hypothetical protein